MQIPELDVVWQVERRPPGWSGPRALLRPGWTPRRASLRLPRAAPDHSPLPSAAMRALVRSVPDSLVRCELTCIDRRPLNVAIARQQHAGYVAALEAAGLPVTVLPADEAHPDCPFVEDVLLSIGEHLILTKPGAPSRRGERAAIRDAFPDLLELTEPLDGGDVLQVAGRVFVGRSTRTSAAAIAWLAATVDRPVTPVDVRSVLHLKTGITALDDHTLLARPGAVDLAPFAGFEVLQTPPGEGEAANVLRLPDRLLVAAGFPSTLHLLRERGYDARPVAIDEFARAEAGLTCLSVLLPGDRG